MSSRRVEPFMALFVRAQQTLGLSQRGIGDLLGLSRSTISRWYSRGAGAVGPATMRTLVAAVYEQDAELAAEIAATKHHTLESLGVVAPAAPPPAPAPPPPAPPAPVIVVPPLNPLVVDTVVCAAAEVIGQPPATLRPILIAAFERARAVGLTVDDVLAGLKGTRKSGAAARG